jgi:DNA-binding transcriptional LysR family regulator
VDVRHLKQILAIHAQGSFGKAADDLGIAQPTLSKSVARLEDELGLKLFHRSVTGAELTPEGMFVVERAARIVGESGRLIREVKLMAAGDFGSVRIGFGPALAPAFLPRFARVAAEVLPNLRMTMTVEARDTLLEDLMSGRKDLFIAADAPDLPALGLHLIPLLRDTAVAVVSPDHPLAGRRGLSVGVLAKHRLAHPAAGGVLQDLLAPHDDAPRFISNDHGAIAALVADGLAVGIFLRHIVRDRLDRGELVQLDIDLGMTSSAVAAMTPAAAHSPVLKRVVELAERVGRELGPPA